MALTSTQQIPLGFVAPDFSLTEVIDGEQISYRKIRGDKGTVVMFICNHCPYVIHVREELVHLANAYLEKGIGFVAISSNDIETYPQDSPDRMRQLAKDLSFPFHYLYDESQQVAKDYFAACTPDFCVFDQSDQCVYRGQLDDSRPGNNVPVTGKSIRTVLDALIIGKEVNVEQIPSIGCGIKWKEA